MWYLFLCHLYLPIQLNKTINLFFTHALKFLFSAGLRSNKTVDFRRSGCQPAGEQLVIAYPCSSAILTAPGQISR